MQIFKKDVTIARPFFFAFTTILVKGRKNQAIKFNKEP